MCGRYTLAAPTPGQLRARFPIGEAVEVRRRFNVAPGDEVLAVTTDRTGAPRGELLSWGLVPSWSDVPETGRGMINARSETVAEKPAFRLAFERFRCLILADGFYEWKHDAGTRRKRAFHITRADGEPFAFAGLWSTWRPSSGDRQEHERVRSCAIVTRAANAAVAPLHDRMPVILDPDAEAAWLDPASPRPLLQEILRGLEAAHTSVREVGGAVNDARYDGPECLAAASPDTQATLF